MCKWGYNKTDILIKYEDWHIYVWKFSIVFLFCFVCFFPKANGLLWGPWRCFTSDLNGSLKWNRALFVLLNRFRVPQQSSMGKMRCLMSELWTGNSRTWTVCVLRSSSRGQQTSVKMPIFRSRSGFSHFITFRSSSREQTFRFILCRLSLCCPV